MISRETDMAGTDVTGSETDRSDPQGTGTGAKDAIGGGRISRAVKRAGSGAAGRIAKIPVAIRLIVLALLVETFVFNFSHWESLTWEKERIAWEDVTPEGSGYTEDSFLSWTGAYLPKDGSFTLRLPAGEDGTPFTGRVIYDLYFDVFFSHIMPIPYTVTLTDEGNGYPYSLPKQQFLPGTERSAYTRLYPTGRAGELEVRFDVPQDAQMYVRGVYANVTIPFSFSLVRFLTLLSCLLLCHALRTPGWLHRPLGPGLRTTFKRDFAPEEKKEESGKNGEAGKSREAGKDGESGESRESGKDGEDRKSREDRKNRKDKKNGEDKTNDRRQWIVTAGVILLLTGLGFLLAHVNPICVSAPWPHHKQYQELAQAMAKGRLYLDAEPSEGLKNAPNPYDTISLQAEGIDYQADYAYYEGKYYVYFGVAPELLLYLPCYLLTGKLLPNWMAVFFFFCGFTAAVFMLYREMIRRWFKDTPFIVYLLLSGLTVGCGNYLFVMARPDLYDTPIMAASMFTAAGLWLWIRGKYAQTKAGRRLCLCLGSLCMALVAGCRPQMLLFSFAAIPLFYKEVMKERKLFTRRSRWETACLCAPYVLVAAGIMWYNAARFGSPFDFGATYSLTSNDMTKRSFNLHQMFLGLWHFFLQPPLVESDFPFLMGNQIASASYMGKLNAEYTYGGLLTCNALTWILLSAGRWKAGLKEKGIRGFFFVNLFVAVVLGIVDVTGAGILQRYMVDLVFGVLLASTLLWLCYMEKARAAGTWRRAATLLFAVFLLQVAYAFCVVFGNGDLSVNVRSSNPHLYYQIRTLFMF